MFFKLCIADPTTKRLVLEQLMEQVEHSLEDLLKQGLDPALLDELRQRPVRDFLRASESSSLELSVELDEGNLRYVFMRVEDERRDRSMKEYFVRHGASAEILNRMFKMSRDEVQALRELFLGEAKTGRHPMPSQFDREEIHRAWDVIVKKGMGQPIRESLFQLHSSFSQHSISALWQVINEFGTVESQVRAPLKSAQQAIQASAWSGGNRVHRTSPGDSAPMSA